MTHLLLMTTKKKNAHRAEPVSHAVKSLHCRCMISYKKGVDFAEGSSFILDTVHGINQNTTMGCKKTLRTSSVLHVHCYYHDRKCLAPKKLEMCVVECGVIWVETPKKKHSL